MGIFKCCCGECELVIGDLPTITITGMTGAGWEEIGQCCFKQEFTYDAEQEWQEDITANYFDCIVQNNDTWNIIGRKPILPTFYTDSSPPPDPITDEWVCCYDYEVMGTAFSEHRTRDQRRMRLRWRFTKVTVYLSQEELACLSDPASLKYIVSLKHNFEWEACLQRLTFCNVYLDVFPTAPCFELISPATERTYYCDEGSEDWADFVEVTPEDDALNYNTSCITSEFDNEHLTKVKWYDTLPAIITFGASDTPTGACPLGCHDINEIADEVCFEADETSLNNGLPVQPTCVASSDSTMYPLVDIQNQFCPTTIAVDVYPDTPPAPPDDCLSVGLIVDVDVTCDPIELRFLSYLDGEFSVFDFAAKIQHKASCYYTSTDPCGIETDYPTLLWGLQHTNKSYATTNSSAPQEACVSSTVVLNVS